MRRRPRTAPRSRDDLGGHSGWRSSTGGPARSGAEIEVEAELTELAGRRLVFAFIAREGARRPGGGRGDGAGGAAAGEGPGGAGVGEGAGSAGSDEDGDLVAGAGSVERIVVDRDKPSSPGHPATGR